MITQEENPSRFGVVETVKYPGADKYFKATSFTEKPSEFISNQVNGGVYIFNTKVLDMIQPFGGGLEDQSTGDFEF
jgi:NDP-sugar pyrophosphorylase family protein